MNIKSQYIATFVFFLILIMAFVIGNHYNRQEQQRILAQAEQEALEQLQEFRTEQLKKHAEQIRCMAYNIYFEAGSEPFMGQVAVARVVMNRVKHGFASSPCKVIYQAHYVPNTEQEDAPRKLCQFSWVCEGRSTPNKNSYRYRQAEEIAQQVILEDKWREDVPASVLFFHSNAVDPGWAYRKIMTIGNHVFYGRGPRRVANESN